MLEYISPSCFPWHKKKTTWRVQSLSVICTSSLWGQRGSRVKFTCRTWWGYRQYLTLLAAACGLLTHGRHMALPRGHAPLDINTPLSVCASSWLPINVHIIIVRSLEFPCGDNRWFCLVKFQRTWWYQHQPVIMVSTRGWFWGFGHF